MKKFLNSIPLTISSMALSFATLGNILSSMETVKPLFGSIAFLLVIIVFLKMIFTNDQFKKDMSNPVIASTFVTLSMCIVVLSTYVKPVSNILGMILWFAGLLSHIIIIIYVLKKFIMPSRKIIPSYYVTFVGIAVAAVTSAAFNLKSLGFVIDIVAFICFIILTIPILKNLFKKDYIPTPANPTKVIVAAPLSLVIVGYINSASSVNLTLLQLCLIIAFILTIIGIYFLVTTLKKSFNPAYAAYTFPITISSFAMKAASAAIGDGAVGKISHNIYNVEIILAVFITVLILILNIVNCITNTRKK